MGRGWMESGGSRGADAAPAAMRNGNPEKPRHHVPGPHWRHELRTLDSEEPHDFLKYSTTQLTMSTKAKLTLLGTASSAIAIVLFVHYQQKADKAAMHQGVIRDMEQQRIKKERQLDFEMQRQLEEEYRKVQNVNAQVWDLSGRGTLSHDKHLTKHIRAVAGMVEDNNMARASKLSQLVHVGDTFSARSRGLCPGDRSSQLHEIRAHELTIGIEGRNHHGMHRRQSVR
nr:protein, mitochondrial [Quercus suber]